MILDNWHGSSVLSQNKKKFARIFPNRNLFRGIFSDFLELSSDFVVESSFLSWLRYNDKVYLFDKNITTNKPKGQIAIQNNEKCQ